MENSDVVVLQGGIGNQLFQYYFGSIHSNLSGRRVLFDVGLLKVDNNRSNLGSRELKLEHLGLMVPKIKLISASHLYSISQLVELRRAKGLKNRLRMVFHFVRTFIFVLRIRRLLEFESNAGDLAVKSRFQFRKLMLGFWQNAKIYEPNRSTILSSVSEYRSIASQNHVLKEMLESGKSLGLHVRRGDYVSNKSALNFHGVLPTNYFIEAIRFHEATFGIESVIIFSDDTTWCKKQNFTNLPVYYCEDFPYNLDYDFDLQELMLLSYSRYMVLSNSSFSWWASFFANDECVVVAPKNWYAHELANSNSLKLRRSNWVSI